MYMYYLHLSFLIRFAICFFGSGGIRTHAIEMTGTWNQRLRPLRHTTAVIFLLGNEETVVLPQPISSNSFSKKIKWH